MYCVCVILVEYFCRMFKEKVIDRFLLKLEYCFFEVLFKSSVKFIKIVVEYFFKGGFLKGYIIFMKIFCNFFDLEYVM